MSERISDAMLDAAARARAELNKLDWDKIGLVAQREQRRCAQVEMQLVARTLSAVGWTIAPSALPDNVAAGIAFSLPVKFEIEGKAIQGMLAPGTVQEVFAAAIKHIHAIDPKEAQHARRSIVVSE